MIIPDQVIKEVKITEKANELSSEQNKYTFEVFPSCNRIQVRKAIESMFQVKVTKVNILNKKGKSKRNPRQKKPGRTSDVKLAIVSLKQGDKIELI